MNNTIILSVVGVILATLAGCSAPVSMPSPVKASTANQVYVLNLQLRQVLAEYKVLDETFLANHQAYEANKRSAAELYAITEKQARQIKELDEAMAWQTGEVYRLAKERDKAAEDMQTLGNTWLELVDRHNALLGRLAAVDNRSDNTTTSNLTAEKRAAFFEMWDLLYPTLRGG